MANSIKKSAGGYALQVTKPAREAGLVIEDSEGKATHLADVLVYGFDDLLVVVDEDDVAVSDRAELVEVAARDSETIHQGQPASLEIAGNGYQVQLPGSHLAGFREGTKAPVIVRRGVLFIHTSESLVLARDLATIREAHISSQY